MLTAEQALSIALDSVKERAEAGKAKAHEALKTLESCIMHNAKLGLTSTEVFPIRLFTFDSPEERNAYITELLAILDQCGYRTEYNVSSQIIQISWA